MPPLSEQRRIVRKLDALFNRSKSAREELAHIPRLVQRYRGAVLTAAFRGDLTDGRRLKNGFSGERDWRQTTLGMVSTDVRYGTSAKCHYEPLKTPVLRIPNVVNGSIDLSDLKYGSFSKEEQEKLALKAGDLLVVRSNGSLDLVGRVALVTKPAVGHLYAGYLIRIRLDSKQVYPAFVQHAFGEPLVRQHIEGLAKSTSGVNNINSEQLKGLSLKIPPLEEQKEIVEKLELAFSCINHIINDVLRADKLLTRFEEAILAKAFRGELVPQDPNEAQPFPVDALNNIERIESEQFDYPIDARKRITSRMPRERSAMTKSRRDEDVNGKPYLTELLRQGSGPTNVEELFRRANLPLTDFYKQLAFEVDAGYIRDDKNKLEAA